MTTVFVLVSLVAHIGFITVLAYLFLRSEGILDTILKNRDNRVNSLDESVEMNRQRISDMVGILNDALGELRAANSSVSNRVTSLETRYGKRSRKEEQEELKQEFFKIMREGPQIAPQGAQK